MKWSIWKKIAGVLVACGWVFAGFIFIIEPMLDNREADKISKFIEALPGDLTADHVNANMLEGTFTISNLHGTLTKADGSPLEIQVLEIIGSGVNEKALESTGTVPLIKEGQVTHVVVKEDAGLGALAKSAPREMLVERMYFHDLRGDAAALAKAETSAAGDALARLFGGLSVGDLSVTSFMDKARTPQGQIAVSADALAFQAGGAAKDNRGSLANTSKLMLPEIITAGIGAQSDQQAVRDGLGMFAQGHGGRLTVTLKPDAPLNMEQLGAGNGISVHAHALFQPAE